MLLDGPYGRVPHTAAEESWAATEESLRAEDQRAEMTHGESDPALPPGSLEIPDDGDDVEGLVCVLCGVHQPNIEEAIDAGWVPTYWDGDNELDGPVCADCAEKHLDTDGYDWFVKPAGEPDAARETGD